MKLNRLYRGIAVFFIAFTLLDIMFPQICGEEMLKISVSEPAHFIGVADDSHGSAMIDDREDSEPNHHSNRSSDNEDCCFCCCAHVLATNRFALVAVVLKSPLDDLKNAFLLSPPLPSAFRPPRLV